MRIDPNKEFGVRECPSCATECPANSNRCPICGYLFPGRVLLGRGLRLTGALILLAVFLFLILRGLR